MKKNNFVLVFPSVFHLPEDGRKFTFDVSVPRSEEYRLGFGNADVVVHYVCGCSHIYTLSIEQAIAQGHICEFCGEEFFISLSAFSRPFSL
jgi:hypothetical protein